MFIHSKLQADQDGDTIIWNNLSDEQRGRVANLTSGGYFTDMSIVEAARSLGFIDAHGNLMTAQMKSQNAAEQQKMHEQYLKEDQEVWAILSEQQRRVIAEWEANYGATGTKKLAEYFGFIG